MNVKMRFGYMLNKLPHGHLKNHIDKESTGLQSIEDGSFESAVFTFNNPLRFAGAYERWKIH